MHHNAPGKYPYRLIATLCFSLAATLYSANMPITSYAAPGDLDPTFSGDGKLTDWSGYAYCVVIQPDGKIVVVGNLDFNGLAIARYNADGSPDTEFGGSGKVLIPLPNYFAADVTVQADAKIIVTGAEGDSNGGVIARLNSNGSLDSTFDGDGMITDLVGAGSVAIQPDGKIVAYVYPQLVRYNSNGTVDTTFTTGTTNSFNDLALQPDGKIVGASSVNVGGVNSDFAVYRFNPNGSLDTTFDSDGTVITPISDLDYATSVSIQTDGKIVVTGSSFYFDGSNSVFALARYLPNGALDTTFDTDGKLITSIDAGDDRASSVSVQSDGQIVVAGTSKNSPNGDFALARYNTNGSLDTTFGGGDGKTTVDFDNSNDEASGMAFDNAGRAVVVGTSANRFAIARFHLAPDLRRNGKIAFTSDRDGNREIYLMNPDGSNQTRLTNNAIIDDFPTWSPDGKKLAFLSQRPTGEFAIFIMNADGTGKTEVTPVTYQPPSPWRGFDWRHMSWSPDGSRIVFTDLVSTIGTIFVVNADGSNRRNLTTGFYPAWSPDGSRILFMRYIGSGNIFFGLYTIRPDGTDIRDITPSFPDFYTLWDSPPIWSPHGQKIAFSATDFANSEIYIANTDGTNPQLFYHICAELAPEGCGFNTAYPAWSPDGSSMAFAVFGYVSRTSEIYVKRFGNGEVTQLTNTTGSNSNPDWQPLPSKSTPFDYDGDGKTDFSVWRQQNDTAPPTWYIAESGSGQMRVSPFVVNEVILPADYDGDGKTDIAAAEAALGGASDHMIWYVLSPTGLQELGSVGNIDDHLLPADYDGDGDADLAAWRPSEGTWYLSGRPVGQIPVQQWGLPGDKPVPADFDGDGTTDLAVWRPSEGRWYVRNLANDSITVIEWGLPGDIPVPGDYSGDGKADFAVYRPSNNTWYRMHSDDFSIHIQTWGLPGDRLTPGDYDGDGKLDLAVWRPAEAKWYVLASTNIIITSVFGLNGDLPTPNAFVY